MTGPNVPKIALLCTALAFLGIGCATTVALAFLGALDERTTPVLVTLIGVVVTTVPSLLGAVFAERASRDIRNGVIVDKTREGAGQAIDDKGVVTREGPAMTATLETLTHLLAAQSDNLRANTDVARELLTQRAYPDPPDPRRPPEGGASVRLDKGR